MLHMLAPQHLNSAALEDLKSYLDFKTQLWHVEVQTF